MLGVDCFTENYAQLKDRPLGLLTNHATFSGSGYPVAHELLRQGFSIKKLFSPEHGILSQGEDGVAQKNAYDPYTKLPIVSLYGESMKPHSSDLEDIDIILIDLPNIGCRFYTYWWTITHMLEACVANRKKIIVLDRPNLSQRSLDSIEGPMLEPSCQSFLGRWPMPLTFSQSFGELTRWFIHERQLDIEWEVIPFSNNVELSFIPPSPSMNEIQAVWLYPCTCLFEGLNVNMGRGTSFPFRVIGAPWLNAIQLHRDFKSNNFEGVESFPYSYQPMWSTYANEFCYGLYFQVTNHKEFSPVKVGLWLMNYLSVHYSSQLKPAIYPTAANPSGEKHLDLLLGIPNAYDVFCGGKSIDNPSIEKLTDAKEWSVNVAIFLASRV
ncbi:MAG: DUF1343 domain-containing protein [Cytophagales bacterium]|nr:DUF1343 domain-containing protein [Cytophagales bacterium]MCA6367111.1 DUF1343 domain-containing protein [Cytophagales bacterium]MCA6372964.1 DUF1343 domain-containing protein [Cytophagales bacterium]MCA6376864.1 DUF1343 domain-containing protein [Cytophagales bacterium]MCA6385776.1 DUF1343 domain-containing protein [Cytophagales bacterium]